MNLPLAIVLVRSRAAGREYHIGVPSADVDYATDGLFVLTSREKSEIVLCMATAEEYRLGPGEGSRRCAFRLQDKLRRDDLAPIVARLEEPAQRSAWRGSRGSHWSFAFEDIHEQAQFADPVCEVSLAAFADRGGVITDLRCES